MEYRIERHQTRPGFLKLVEQLTGSVVRLQTDDELITKTFWNNYPDGSVVGFASLAAGKEAENSKMMASLYWTAKYASAFGH